MSDELRCLHAFGYYAIICFPAQLLSVDTNIYGRFSLPFTYIFGILGLITLSAPFTLLLLYYILGWRKEWMYIWQCLAKGLSNFVF